MLLTYWVLSIGVTIGFRFSETNQPDMMFAIALTLFFGTTIAIPLIAYLLFADMISRLFSFPRSVLIYLVVVALGWALYTWLGYSIKDFQFPQTPEALALYFWGLSPLLATAAIPLLFQILSPPGDNTRTSGDPGSEG
jgi:hypothetical protein